MGGSSPSEAGEPSGGAHSSTDGGASSDVDPFASLPTIGLTHVRDVELRGFTDEPEDLYVDAQGIRIVTLKDEYLFSLDGTLLSAPDPPSHRSPARGIDGTGAGEFATVYRNVVSWYSFEQLIEMLASTEFATGIALQPPGASRFFVTDSTRRTLSEYLSASELVREVELPGTDAQGVALSVRAGLVVLDAARSRILRVVAGKVDGIAELPSTGAGAPTGVHFDEQDLLYVCFKQPARISVFSMAETAAN